MQQSLKILTDVPDYADRVNRLETLKNRLEALMSPTVIAAFNTRDVGMNKHFSLFFFFYTKIFSIEMARSFAQVFQSIDRAEQLEELYVTSVKVTNSSHKLKIHLKALIYYLDPTGYTYSRNY
jgi:hypothetical protein